MHVEQKNAVIIERYSSDFHSTVRWKPKYRKANKLNCTHEQSVSKRLNDADMHV